jgi:hypothetical protein
VPVIVRESIPGEARKGLFQMSQKRYGIDQIIPMLRRADVELGKGRKVPEICKLLGCIPSAEVGQRGACWLEMVECSRPQPQ